MSLCSKSGSATLFSLMNIFMLLRVKLLQTDHSTLTFCVMMFTMHIHSIMGTLTVVWEKFGVKKFSSMM